MDLYTVQLARGRNDPDLLDITAKSAGHVGRVFAPTWDMVIKHQRGEMTDEQYESCYYHMMLVSYHVNKDKWDWILSQPRIVLACYCRKGKFCHRHLLVKYLVKLGATYRGEI